MNLTNTTVHIIDQLRS